ncbi:hypothetical protein NAI42_12035, partial [Francisella tularensis subsp. holarctica]|nr:hypothetical protein [Francisella tularensis subsp. holarctica]
IPYEGHSNRPIAVAIRLPKGVNPSNSYSKRSSDGRAYQLSEFKDGVTHLTINVDASDKYVNKFDDEVSI